MYKPKRVNIKLLTGYKVLKLIYYRRFRGKRLILASKNVKDFQRISEIVAELQQYNFIEVIDWTGQDGAKGFSMIATLEGLNYIEKRIESKQRKFHNWLMVILTVIIAGSTVVNVWISCERESPDTTPQQKITISE
jgi:hypothetical protein